MFCGVAAHHGQRRTVGCARAFLCARAVVCVCVCVCVHEGDCSPVGWVGPARTGVRGCCREEESGESAHCGGGAGTVQPVLRTRRLLRGPRTGGRLIVSQRRIGGPSVYVRCTTMRFGRRDTSGPTLEG